ncbi:MAG: deoxyribonuclease V [Gammaproteobacteria bacterium]
MKLLHRHRWDVSAQQAIAIQKQLRSHLICADQLGSVHYVAGVDVGFEERGRVTRAAVALLEYPSLALHESALARKPTAFPYIPGLLSFRELPASLAALEQLQQLPDLLLCDGQGYAHPRRFGLACHLGVLTDIPAIGVGKTRLIGTHEVVADVRGAWQPLHDKDEVIGAVVRTRRGVKPIYISVGHRISLGTAIHYVMACTRRYKLPETTRMAHKYASHPSAIL